MLGPNDRRSDPPAPSPENVEACNPIDPFSVTRGKRSATDTPINAVAEARLRSAIRISGRRRSNCPGSPMATNAGNVKPTTAPQCLRQRRRPLPRQHTQTMRRVGRRSLHRRNRRQRRVPLRPRPLDIQVRPRSRFQPRLRDLQRFLLIRRVPPQHRQFVLRPAQVKIIPRHLADQAHLRVAPRRPPTPPPGRCSIPPSAAPAKMSSSHAASKPASYKSCSRGAPGALNKAARLKRWLL